MVGGDRTWPGPNLAEEGEKGAYPGSDLSMWGKGMWPGPKPATQLRNLATRREGWVAVLIATVLPLPKFSDPWGDPQVRCYSSSGLIWPIGQGLSTPELNYFLSNSWNVIFLLNQLNQFHKNNLQGSFI